MFLQDNINCSWYQDDASALLSLSCCLAAASIVVHSPDTLSDTSFARLGRGGALPTWHQQGCVLASAEGRRRGGHVSR